MRLPGFLVRFGPALVATLGIVFACGFDDSVREYLDSRFWLPFSKQGSDFIQGVRRINEPFAGMATASDESPLARLSAAYQDPSQYSFTQMRSLLEAARADKNLSVKQTEELALLDAKIDMREGEPDKEAQLRQAQRKFEQFVQTARTAAYRSEARGWIAHIHYALGEQTAAGKIYLDELNRPGSNLSAEVLLNSLMLTYGYDGGPGLIAHLPEYFDTPEHAAFAIGLVTNPHWERIAWQQQPSPEPPNSDEATYAKIKDLLNRHAKLFRNSNGASLTLLGMRTALRMGDPAEALRIAQMAPANAPWTRQPDFLWMSASAYFLSHQFAGAEQPLLALFSHRTAPPRERAAAAYALCGVYEKTGNAVEQIRFALWLRDEQRKSDPEVQWPADITDKTIYWAPSGFDLGLLLEFEAPDEALEQFIEKYPAAAGLRLVEYALAVRRARENRYADAAALYEAVHATRRATRMRQLASLWADANRTDASGPQLVEGKYQLASFLAQNEERIYFNDTLWRRFQQYAFVADKDTRLSLQERQKLIAGERKLKDEQEERWRAYLILRDIVNHSDDREMRRKSALLARKCLRQLSIRFEREDEIQTGLREMNRALR